MADAPDVTIEDMIYFVGLSAMEIELAQERLVNSFCRDKPDPRRMLAAKAHAKLARLATFMKHCPDQGALARLLRDGKAAFETWEAAEREKNCAEFLAEKAVVDQAEREAGAAA